LIDKVFDTRLIYNRRKPEYIQITIFYDNSFHLFERFENIQGKGISILELIKKESPKFKWQHPDYYDFSHSKIIEIKDSSSWEHNKKPLVLIVDNLNVIVESRYAGDGRFKITQNIFQHLDQYIRYGSLGLYTPDDRFIEKNLNKETSFGPIKFILSFDHSYNQNYTPYSITILRDAYLTITEGTNELNDNQLIDLGIKICSLMSLYWEKQVDFFSAQIRINKTGDYKTREVLKYCDNELDKSSTFLLKNQFETFYELVKEIDYEKFITNSELLQEVIPRIIKAKEIDNISSFMILYNIIEKIRNYFLENPLDDKPFIIKEEFQFSKGKGSTDKYIKNKIKEITEIVIGSDKEEFDKIASDKVTFIRKTGLKDQFNSLINYLELNSSSYEIDFIELIKIRNSIYHGKLPKEDISHYINQMNILIYDMILKTITK
jgi:hypothetical protein